MKPIVFIGPYEWIAVLPDGSQKADSTYLFQNIDGGNIAGFRAQIAQRYWPERTISNPFKLYWQHPKPSHPYAQHKRQISNSIMTNIIDQVSMNGMEVVCFLPYLLVKKLKHQYPNVEFRDLFLLFSDVVTRSINHSEKWVLLIFIHASIFDIGVVTLHHGQDGSLDTYYTYAFESEAELTVLIALLPVLIKELELKQNVSVYVAGRTCDVLAAALQANGFTIHEVAFSDLITINNALTQINNSQPTVPENLGDLIRQLFNIRLGQFSAQLDRIISNDELPAVTPELKKLRNLVTFFLANISSPPIDSAAETLRYLTEVLNKNYTAIGELKRCLMHICVGSRTLLKTVTLLGKFSWGKSILLNAILGDNILSADLRAETKRLTKVIQGSCYAEIIEYANEVCVTCFVSVGQLAERVKSISSVRGDEFGDILEYHVVVPTLPGWEDILLLDTPGYSSRFKDHDCIADSAWHESDVILAIYDPSQVGEANFTAKVRQVLDAGKHVVFVITKRDQIEGRECNLQKELCSALSQDVRVLFVSGYQALFGRKWLNGTSTLDDIQQDWNLYVNEDGVRITGARLRLEHAPLMLEFSNIDRLEQTIWTMLGEPI